MVLASRNPDIPVPVGGHEFGTLLPFDNEVLFMTVCNVGAVSNYITNSTLDPNTGNNEWTILLGNASLAEPSMNWDVPEIYAGNNNYLYYGSLRIGRGNKLLHLSTDTSPGGDIYLPPNSISDYDTHFYISDQSELVPDIDKLNMAVHQDTYAWGESDVDDFIIYEYWIVNLNDIPIDSVYVALHIDGDLSSAAGGSGLEGYWRDDTPDYFRDNDRGEYISYMYDDDNPNIAGDDTGGRLDPRESLGYLGSRLLYCPPAMGESTPSIQKGHIWWDWNSDPGSDSDWMAYMKQTYWLDPPPSPHDFRYLQNLGPFQIMEGDSIRVVFAFGIGEGLNGLRSNLQNAQLLFDYGYQYSDIPPDSPRDFTVVENNETLEFSWRPVESADLAGYNIYQGDNPDGPFAKVNGNPIDTVFYQYTPAQHGLFYFYATAEDLDGNESIPSDMVNISTLPFPPGNFRAVPGDNLVQLSWSANDEADAYRIYRSDTHGGPYTQIAEIDAPEHSYTDTDVINYAYYYYVATTLAGGDESPYCGEVEVRPDPALTGRVLLVDDYQEVDEAGFPLTYQERRRFYQRWGVYNYDYDVWVIADQGMPDLATLQEYDAILFASDGDGGDSDFTWWFDVGAIGGGVLREYLEGDGKLLAIGQVILQWIYNSNPPNPGDFEYDWFGVGNDGDWAWDYWFDFTWAIGNDSSYPDSMQIDVSKVPDQIDMAEDVQNLRSGAQAIFLKGLSIDGSYPEDYMESVGMIFRPDGIAKTSLINFSLYNMPGEDVHTTINNILRYEFGCSFYEDPAPLPPWHAAVTSIVGEGLLLSWENSDEDDVVSINLYRSVDNGAYQLYQNFDIGTSEYLDTDIANGLSYRYKFKSVDFAGQEGRESPEISEVGGRPSIPGDFTVVSLDEQVDLSWGNPAEPGISGYRIYRRTGPNSQFYLITEVPAGDSSFSDTDIFNRLGYYYCMTSVSDFGVESYPSDTLFAFPHGPQLEGILVVNGIDWATYGAQVVNLYYNHSFTGSFPYGYWDLFETLPWGDFPDPQNVFGLGEFPSVFFDAYQTIIWAGNNYNGDLDQWQANLPNIVGFLQSGGNLILSCRSGSDFFDDALTEFAGVDPDDWVYSSGSFYLISTHPDLTDIGVISGQSFCDFPMITEDYTTRLWKPSLTQYDDYAGGFIAEPPGLGKFVFISGRPYRWDNLDLRDNMEIILGVLLDQTDIDPAPSLPESFSLSQNYPNPFNPSTTIKFGLPSASDVRLEVFDILGRSVTVLVDKQLDAGYHDIVWDGRNASGGETASGIYFYKLKAGDYISTKKMLMLK